MLNEIDQLGQATPARLIQKLHINAEADIQRRAISYVFHAVQQSYATPKKPKQVVRQETFDFLLINLEHRSKTYERFVDVIFPDQDPVRRGALSLALICDDAMRTSSEHHPETFNFGGFDEDTIELAVMFFEEAQDITNHGAKALSVGVEPESLFLAHVNADDGLEVILSDYSKADPHVLKALEANFFKITCEFTDLGDPFGRYIHGRIENARAVICEHLKGGKFGKNYLLPDNENRLEF